MYLVEISTLCWKLLVEKESWNNIMVYSNSQFTVHVLFLQYYRKKIFFVGIKYQDSQSLTLIKQSLSVTSCSIKVLVCLYILVIEISVAEEIHTIPGVTPGIISRRGKIKFARKKNE